MRSVSAVLALVLSTPSVGLGQLPDRSYAPDQALQIISPSMGEVDHNQPSAVSGALLLAGNAIHTFWDIRDPFSPVQLSEMVSPHHDGEAESHSITFMTDGERRYAATISGRGVDLWDVTDPRAPELLSAIELEGIDYGDNTEAVWGVSWEGRYLYAGGTNTGLHVIDTAELREPRVVGRIPVSEVGGVSVGVVYAVGNLLVVGTPKERAGLATLDIANPESPTLLDFVVPDAKSYIGAFYGRHAYLLTPLRTYDVTTDPSDIRLVHTLETPASEYVSFADHHLFLGRLRPNPGVIKHDIRDPLSPIPIAVIEGRRNDILMGAFTDDQFSFPIGNLLVISDDEIDIGSVLTVHDSRRDSAPPEVLYANPPDGALDQAPTTRIGLSMSDHVDLQSLSTESFIVREIGGDAIEGRWGVSHTVLSFSPEAPLETDSTYEIVLPAGGITDLVGNPIAMDYRSVFSTGDALVELPCSIATTPAEIGELVSFDAPDGDGLTYSWDFGDGETADGERVTHTYARAGRHPITLHVASAEGSRSCSATQVVHYPPTAPPSTSSTIAVSNGRVFVVNPDANTVAAFDVDADAPIFEVEVDARPTTLAIADDGTLWVACRDADALVHLDPDGSRLGEVRLHHGAAPHGVVVRGTMMLVAQQGGAALTRIHTGTLEVVGELDLPAGVRGVALDGAGTEALVTRFISSGVGEVYRVDVATMSLLDTIELARDPGPDTTRSSRGIPSYLSQIAISPDGRRAWIPSSKANVERGLALDGELPNPDNTVRTIVSQIDLASGAELLEARVDLDNHEGASAVAFSPLGDLAFVTTRGTHRVDVIDTVSGLVVAGFSTALVPEGLVLHEGVLYVQAFLGRSVSRFDVVGILRGTDLAPRPLGDVPTVATEPLSDVVLRGKRIFYNADSPQMSRDGYLSCASCHLEGGHDGQTWDFTHRGEGLRNTTDLRGRAGTAHGPVHWTANFDEIQDFENDIRAHFGGSGFLTDDDFAASEDPLGEPKAGRSEALDALAAYVASLSSTPRSPYRLEDGSMSELARRGREVFARLDCLDCHRGPAFTDSGEALHDVGTIRASSGTRRFEPLTGIDTPTLRGVWATAPYFHDGSASTLRDVLTHPGHGGASDISEDELRALEAFLLSLDDDVDEVERALIGGSTGGACTTSGEVPGGMLTGLIILWVMRRRPRLLD